MTRILFVIMACVLLGDGASASELPFAPQQASGLQAEVRARQDEPAFVGEGQGSSTLVLTPWYLWQPDALNLGAVTARLFASSRDGTDIYATSRDTARQYLELTELWWQREAADDVRRHTRVGIQQVDDDSQGLWWDALLTGASWRFDGTLLDAHAGIGSRSSYLRSDTDVTSPEAQQALLAFGQVRRQWRLDHFATLRAAVRDDPAPGYVAGDVLARADFAGLPTSAAWLNAEASGEFRPAGATGWPRYLVETALVQGERTRFLSGAVAGVPDQMRVSGQQDQDIAGSMLRLEAQYIWQRNWRLRAGGGVLWGSGGDGLGEAGFVSTGLDSNRGNLFGTGARGHVNGESMRLGLENVQVANLHAAMSLGASHDLVIAVREARRVDARGDVFLGGIRLPGSGDAAIGDSVDLVYAWRRQRLFGDGSLTRSGFDGRQFTATVSAFNPAFADPGKTVSGIVLNLEYRQTF